MLGATHIWQAMKALVSDNSLIVSVKIINKSAAGMQHTPSQDIFSAKKIILKLDLFMQCLKKIGKEMPKIITEKPFYNVNQGP